MKLPFSKYQGLGNDFILIDDRKEIFPIQDDKLIARLCSRQFGIGADGLILLQTSQVADYRMRIFNCDGREASFCGNGLRCLVSYIEQLKSRKEQVTIETGSSTLACTYHLDKIAVNMPIPTILHLEEQVDDHLLSVIDTGVPHAVFFVEDLKNFPLEDVGRKIRFHSKFSPFGVNVNCIQEVDNTIHIRTYERGVESETLSCGSGAAAAAFLFAKKRTAKPPIIVMPKSQEPLEFTFLEKGMQMLGPARFVFSGIVDIN